MDHVGSILMEQYNNIVTKSQLLLYDPFRNPNMDYKNHRVGQQTMSHHALLAFEMPSTQPALVAESRTWVDKELVHL